MQIIVNLESATDFTRSQGRVFLKYFFNSEEDYTDIDTPSKRNFYALDELREFIEGSVDVIFLVYLYLFLRTTTH